MCKTLKKTIRRRSQTLASILYIKSNPQLQSKGPLADKIVVDDANVKVHMKILNCSFKRQFVHFYRVKGFSGS
jgi:hypothetical protein